MLHLDIVIIRLTMRSRTQRQYLRSSTICFSVGISTLSFSLLFLLVSVVFRNPVAKQKILFIGSRRPPAPGALRQLLYRIVTPLEIGKIVRYLPDKKFRLLLKLSLLRRSRPKSVRPAPNIPEVKRILVLRNTPGMLKVIILLVGSI